MYKVKQFMNKITDKGTAEPSSGVVQNVDDDRDGQVSAEGFLCPDCMTAYASPELLAEHYSTKHLPVAASANESYPDDDKHEHDLSQEHELIELRTALESERKQFRMIERRFEEVFEELEGYRKSAYRIDCEQTNAEEEKARWEDECLGLRKQVEDWSLKYNKTNSDLELVKTSAAEEQKVLRESLDVLRKQFLELQNKAAISEAECKNLREEIQRLRDRHAELVRGIEGDAGMQAAIESLTKERDGLQATLDTVQTQNRELTKNLHNAGLELDNLRKDSEIISSQFDAYKLQVNAEAQTHRKEVEEKDRLYTEEVKEHNRSKSSCELLRTQVLSQTDEIKNLKSGIEEKVALMKELEKSNAHFKEQITVLTAEVEALKTEVSHHKDQCLSGETKIKELEKSLAKSAENVYLLEAEKDSLQMANRSIQNILEEQSKAFNRYLADVSNVLGMKHPEYRNHYGNGEGDVDARESNYDAYQKHSNAIVKGMSEKIISMKESQELLQNEMEKMKQELMNSKSENESCASRNTELAKDLKVQKEEHATVLERLQKEMEEDRKFFDDKLNSAKKVETQVAQLTEQVTTLQSDAKRFQDERDNLQAERLELDKKYKSSEEARSLLMDRCLASESESETYNETIQGLQRKLADALAALQELGRENQSLQVESAKLQGRKWTDDSNVSNCSNCSKEFSITIRKHHCRVCGNIFCHDCSARTASIPSCKKPVRVCDACAADLAK